MVRAAQSAMSNMDMGTLKQMAKMVDGIPRRRADRIFDPPPQPSPSTPSTNTVNLADRSEHLISDGVVSMS